MYTIAPKSQKNSLGDTLIFATPKTPRSGTITTKFDAQEVKGIDNHVTDFKNYLVEDGKSPKTLESYVGDISGFVQYISRMGLDLNGEMKRFHITSFRNYLVENDYEPATINKKVNSLQAFNRYLIGQGKMNDMVVDLRKDRVKIAGGSEKQVETYDEKQLNKLLSYIQGDKVSIRDRAIILTLLYTGVRVSELCSIKIRNIDFLTGYLKIVGKGGKIREIPLKLEVTEAIKEYLIERNQNKYSNSEYLFLGQRGAIKRDAVNTLLEKYSREIKAEVKLKPHTFRHTFCTRLINKGVPLTTVSKLAGHSNIETTAKFYINSSKEDKMRAINVL